jgi:hypothetical protein
VDPALVRALVDRRENRRVAETGHFQPTPETG